jgi:hypothetical protein
LTRSALAAFASALAFAMLAAAPGDALARRSGALRTQPIDTVVIHSTGGPTCDATTGRPVWIQAGTLDDNLRRIEAHPALGIHYMIDRDGSTRASVPEDRVAHHVFGASGRSIAIELINDGDGRDPFPAAQLDALVALLGDIRQRRGIARSGVVRHSDLDHAPLPCDRTQRRKVDPGDAFPHRSILDRVFRPQSKPE